MKILHAVQFYHPAVGGMEEVVKQLSESMSKLGHDVTVLTSTNSSRHFTELNGVRIVDFEISGNLAKGMHGDLENCQKFLRENQFDIITCFAAQQWATDIFFYKDLLKELKSKKVFVPTGFSGLFDPLYYNYFENMKEWFLWFDKNVFLSNDYRDINFARKNNVTNEIIIPNGASKAEFNRKWVPKNNDVFKILHVGNHTGQKGHTELIQLYSRSKIDKSELLIVGRHNWKGRCFLKCKLKVFFWNIVFKLNRSQKKILMKELSRKQTIEEFYRANLFLFPSNIECSPIVLFEAMASCTPFLSSAAGNAQEIIEWTEAGVLLPTIKKDKRVIIEEKESQKVFEELCLDKQKLKTLAKNGYDAWTSKFTWEAISQRYIDMYETLLENKS
ncbi:MAG: glycosyltransferase family 4 protein [Halobacteriovoraceae bacterium]|nr:glycosyltransferase family 4 protein [Halobacteriovoraceae bacterium]